MLGLTFNQFNFFVTQIGAISMTPKDLLEKEMRSLSDSKKEATARIDGQWLQKVTEKLVFLDRFNNLIEQ